MSNAGGGDGVERGVPWAGEDLGRGREGAGVGLEGGKRLGMVIAITTARWGVANGVDVREVA